MLVALSLTLFEVEAERKATARKETKRGEILVACNDSRTVKDKWHAQIVDDE